MEELRGTVRQGAEEIFDEPRIPAKLLLDDINKIQVELTDNEWVHRYKSYPESHHLEEEERR